MAEIDVVLGKSVDAGEPVILSDQFDGCSNAGVAGKWGIMVSPQDVHTVTDSGARGARPEYFNLD